MFSLQVSGNPRLVVARRNAMSELRLSSHYHKRVWQLAHGKSIELGPRALIMGIVNVTPDSFSDGGRFHEAAKAADHAARLVEEGADIIDIGGESTRPGAEPVSPEEEIDRIIPVIEELVTDKDVIISVDTYRSQVASAAMAAGVHIVNDVWGFQKDPKNARIAAKAGAGVCAMHSGRERQKLSDVVEDQIVFLQKSLKILSSAGVEAGSIVLDPGFGFAKDARENVALLSRFDELQALGFPLLVGTSRKRFIGELTGQTEENRDIGTAATSVVARMKGGAIFRVHDVATNRDALAVADAVIAELGGMDV